MKIEKTLNDVVVRAIDTRIHSDQAQVTSRSVFIIIPSDIAEEMRNEGWSIKHLPEGLDEAGTDVLYVDTAYSFKAGERVKADVNISGFKWTVGTYTKITARLDTMREKKN